MDTPFNSAGDLTEGPVRDLIGLLKSEGVPAFLVSGSTGEQHSMTVEERSRLYRWSKVEAGSAPVWAGVAAVNHLTEGRETEAAAFFASWAVPLKTVVKTQLPASLKYALRTAGRPGGWCREPLGHLSPAQEAAIAALVR